jgi:hypothetical protein
MDVPQIDPYYVAAADASTGAVGMNIHISGTNTMYGVTNASERFHA